MERVSGGVQNPRFIADDHLGRLARHLRLLGFDTLYQPPQADDWLIATVRDQSRILLSKDREFVSRIPSDQALLLRALRPREQLLELIERLHISDTTMLVFSRCLDCNGVIELVENEEVLEPVEASTRGWYDTFYRCSECGKVYWKGGHYERMKAWVLEIVSNPRFAI